MTLRQLEVFLAVAREKSFSRAATRIHSSQPTLSEHVSELEGELGKKLFFRQGRGREVTMTEAGRVFEQYAAAAVSAVEGARQALADLDGLAHGSLLIGASTTPGLYVMPSLIAAFRAKYSGVEAFGFGDTFMSSTTKRGESRRAPARSWNCSSKRHRVGVDCAAAIPRAGGHDTRPVRACGHHYVVVVLVLVA